MGKDLKGRKKKGEKGERIGRRQEREEEGEEERIKGKGRVLGAQYSLKIYSNLNFKKNQIR